MGRQVFNWARSAARLTGISVTPRRDAIMKEDPDKPKRMRSKGQEGEEESPASPVTDVSPGSVR